MLMINTLLSVTLDEKDKRILIIVFLLILLLLIFLGLMNRLLNWYLTKKAKKIDEHIAGYVKYGFVSDEKELKKVGAGKNHLIFIKEASIPLLALIIVLSIFLIYCLTAQIDWTYIFRVYDDIIFELEAPTTIMFGLEIWSDWPTIVEGSIIVHNNFEGYIAYILFIAVLIGTISYLFAVLRMNARKKRIEKKAKELFKESLDNTAI